jgi:hypothetical protein
VGEGDPGEAPTVSDKRCFYSQQWCGRKSGGQQWRRRRTGGVGQRALGALVQEETQRWRDMWRRRRTARGSWREREREVVGMCEREMVSYDPGTEESKEA